MDALAFRVALVASGLRHISAAARQAGIERTRLNRAALNQLQLRPDEQQAIAAVLDRSVDELFPESVSR